MNHKAVGEAQTQDHSVDEENSNSAHAEQNTLPQLDRTLRAAGEAPDGVTGLWRPIETAPKDRRILLWCIHANAKYAKDPIAEGWEATVIGEWTDHNGGGWTWHGMAGRFTHWMPLPTSPTTQAGSGFPEEGEQ